MSGGVPGIATNRNSNKVERMIGNSGIDVNSSIVAETVIRKGLVVLHVSRLRILSNQVIVICRARSLERPERVSFQPGGEYFCSDEPVCTCSVLFEHPLFYQRTEHV